MPEFSFKLPECSPIVFGDGRQIPNVFPGPMDGVSEGSFVSVMTAYGFVQSWHTPFMRISTGVPGWSRIRAYMAPYLATGLPVTVQLMGTSTERLAETAYRVHECGAACVDLNCACPSNTVVSNDSGGARLKYPEWIRQTLQAMRQKLGTGGLSIKARMGFETPDEFPEIANAIREGGADLAIIHFRTVKELYAAVPNGLERLRTAVSCLPDIPVIGSGDLFSAGDCLKMMTETGVAGVAPARGLMKYPPILMETMDALSGRTATREWNPIAFLHDIAETAERRQGHSNGFVLRLCNAIFGASSPLFQAMTTWKTLEQTTRELEQLL